MTESDNAPGTELGAAARRCQRPVCRPGPEGGSPVAAALESLEWSWLNDLVVKTGSDETRRAAEALFTRLLDAETAPAIGETLEEIDEWERELRGDAERQVARALKLLGVDKKLSVERGA